MDWLQTWGSPGRPIAEISKESAKTQEEKAKQLNFNRDKSVIPGKIPPKGALAFFNAKGIGPVADELVTICET